MKKKFYKIYLGFKQKRINKQLEKKGFTDEILEKQIALNIRRSELNIPDEKELLSEAVDFVQ